MWLFVEGTRSLDSRVSCNYHQKAMAMKQLNNNIEKGEVEWSRSVKSGDDRKTLIKKEKRANEYK